MHHPGILRHNSYMVENISVTQVTVAYPRYLLFTPAQPTCMVMRKHLIRHLLVLHPPGSRLMFTHDKGIQVHAFWKMRWHRSSMVSGLSPLALVWRLSMQRC